MMASPQDGSGPEDYITLSLVAVRKLRRLWAIWALVQGLPFFALTIVILNGNSTHGRLVASCIQVMIFCSTIFVGTKFPRREPQFVKGAIFLSVANAAIGFCYDSCGRLHKVHSVLNWPP